MKNRSSLNGKSFLVVVLASVLVIALLSRRYEVASASAGGLPPQPEISTRQVPSRSESSSIAEVNGVEIDASNFRMENGIVKVDVCFERITEADWNLSRSSLNIEGGSIQSTYWALIDYRYDESGAATHRCDVVTFPYSNPFIAGEVAVVVPRLETSRNENIDCPAAQEKLEGTGIQIECFQTENSGGYNLLGKPEHMSLEEAHRLASDAFIEVLDGPWILHGELK